MTATSTSPSASRELLSVVVPVYRCGPCQPELCRRLLATADDMGVRMEIVLVNDGCPEGSWDIIQQLAAADPRIKGINLFRNFGQHIAISAGLQHARGDWVAVMDGDLQDVPEELPKLLAKTREGYDAVFGRRRSRQDSLFKRFCSWSFSTLLGVLSGTKLDSTVANYSVISRAVRDTLVSLPERHRTYGLLVHWLGPKTAYVDIAHARREIGESSYSLARQIRLALDAVVSHSTRPLIYSVGLGLLSAAFAICYFVTLVLGKLIYGYSVEGWASTIASVWLFGGLTLSQLGIIGLYLGKTYVQVQQRPLYVVRDILNESEADMAGNADVQS